MVHGPCHVSAASPSSSTFVTEPLGLPFRKERDRRFESGSLQQRVKRNRWLEPLRSAPEPLASRDSAYPARGSTHSRKVQAAHLALVATRENRATRGDASAARNCVRGIVLPGWPRAGTANRSSLLIGRCPARIFAESISPSVGHDGGSLRVIVIYRSSASERSLNDNSGSRARVSFGMRYSSRFACALFYKKVACQDHIEKKTAELRAETKGATG